MQDGTPLWEPPTELRERSHMARLMADRGVDDYASLWQWSVDDLAGFWAEVWRRFDVGGEPGEVLADATMPGAVWFPQARLNYAERVFRDKPDDRVAIVHASELRELGEWTWGDLRAQTAGIRAGLVARGVGPGDRVAAYLPNVPETIAAFLAVASLGAVWSSAAPEFGARSVIDRFGQIEPKVLLAVDGYRYGGKDFDKGAAVDAIAAEIGAPVVRLGYLDGSGWEDGFLGDDELAFAPVPFDHPLWVLYSSGTTGLPKAIVQGQGGILLEHLKMMYLHLDCRPGDRVFWFTTTGWMMWNFLVSVLLTDAAIVLYDGNPGTPGPRAAVGPRRGRRDDDLRHERELPRVVHEGGDRAGRRPRPVRAAGGGVDRLAARARGLPLGLRPRRRRHVAVLHLGRDRRLHRVRRRLPRAARLPRRAAGAGARRRPARVRRGRRTRSIDEVGELVLTQPMPSMPLSFWDDEDGARLREAYFDHYPGVWRHGDWIRITPRGTAVIYGRSDSTINRGGVRMGTSEIYRAVLALDDVVDALVVDVPREGEENWMPLFVVLRDGAELDDDLVARDPQARARGLLAAPRPERDPGDRRGAAHALGQGARGPGQADPHGRGARARGEPRLAREPRRARLLRRAAPWVVDARRHGEPRAAARPPPRASGRRRRRPAGSRRRRVAARRGSPAAAACGARARRLAGSRERRRVPDVLRTTRRARGRSARRGAARSWIGRAVASAAPATHEPRRGTRSPAGVLGIERVDVRESGASAACGSLRRRGRATQVGRGGRPLAARCARSASGTRAAAAAAGGRAAVRPSARSRLRARPIGARGERRVQAAAARRRCRGELRPRQGGRRARPAVRATASARGDAGAAARDAARGAAHAVPRPSVPRADEQVDRRAVDGRHEHDLRRAARRAAAAAGRPAPRGRARPQSARGRGRRPGPRRARPIATSPPTARDAQPSAERDVAPRPHPVRLDPRLVPAGAQVVVRGDREAALRVAARGPGDGRAATSLELAMTPQASGPSRNSRLEMTRRPLRDDHCR